MTKKNTVTVLTNLTDFNQERCVTLGQYIVDTNSTVRSTAKKFGISKSTVHQDITAKLEKVCPQLHSQVKEVLEKNKQERHLRGGAATKQKYANLSKKTADNTDSN